MVREQIVVRSFSKRILLVYLGLQFTLVTGAAQVPDAPMASTFVSFDQSDFSDSDWSVLAEVLADEVPKTQWPEVSVHRGDGLHKIIDRYYDIYQISDGTPYSVPLPKTLDTLTRLIKTANDLTSDVLSEGSSLKVPLIPIRPATGPGLPLAARLYDPQREIYAVVDGDGISEFPPGSEPWIAAEAQRLRLVTNTTIPVTDEHIDELRRLPTKIQRLDYARVTLLRQARPKPCHDADPLLTQSPYLPLARQRIRDLYSDIQAAADTRQLALVDFDFVGDGGHGAKVYSAVYWLLNHLDADDLLTKVDRVDLNPTNNEKRLQQMLSAYEDHLTVYGESNDQIPLAGWWTIVTQDNQPGDTLREIPVVMASAALFDTLKKGSWLNLSWRIEAATSVQPFRMAKTLQKRGSFVAVAAGNDGEVRYDIFPQSQSSAFLEFTNVTYGSPTGQPYGSVTGVETGGKVDLMAVGCGFHVGSLVPEDHGSSYASPVVLAAAWLKHLVDGVPSERMRRTLLRAALLVPPASGPTTVSGGLFDPARLLAFRQTEPHYLDVTRTQLYRLNSVSLQTGQCGTYESVVGNAVTQDMIVYEKDGRYFLLRRHDVRVFPGVSVEPPCEVSDLTLFAEGSSGNLLITSAAEFVATIGHLTF